MTDRAFRKVRRTMRHVSDAIPDTGDTEVLLRLGHEGAYVGALSVEDVEVLASHRCATRASMRIGYANALAEMHYLLRGRLPTAYTRDTTAALPTQASDLAQAIHDAVGAAKTAGWQDAIITAAENLRVAPRHLDRTGRAPMSMSDLIIAVAEVGEDTRQSALNTVADELLPADKCKELGPHFSAETLAAALGNHATVTDARNEAIQAELRTLAAELLPAPEREALGEHYTTEMLAQVLSEHAVSIARANGRGGYERGKAEAPVLDERALQRARWDGAVEAAQSIARQLYGPDARGVRNGKDLVALVRAQTEFEVREATGETIHEGTQVHTPLRDERIRRDTLRASLSWVSQNWNLDLDTDGVRTPEDLGARLTTAMDQRVADARDQGRLQGAMQVHQQITGQDMTVYAAPKRGAQNKILAVTDALREHIGQLLRDAAEEHAPLRVGVGRAERVRYRTEGALSVYRWFTGGQELERTAEYRAAPNKVAAVVYALRAHVVAERQGLRPDLDVLQELHNHLHGPDDTGERWDILPEDTTVTSYAAGLRTAAKDTARRIESEVCGGVLRYLGIDYDEPADKPLVREDAAFLIRKHTSAEASRRARAVDIRQNTDEGLRQRAAEWYDGPQGGSVGTTEDGVELSDRQGRQVFLRWPDAILYAQTILLAADVRGLRKALADEADRMRAEMSSPHDGAPSDMYGDDVDG